MNKTVIITGVSSGIGNSLANYYISQNWKVIGIGRNNTIRHPNFTFFQKDLSSTTDFHFLIDAIQLASELILINNAGTIGNIERISEQQQSDIETTLQINTIAPMLLSQYILQTSPLEKPLTIVNISSGAARKSIPAWASYCASKAALESFSQTIYLEEKERNRNIKVYSISPGVVDTPMQEKIRIAPSKNFSSLQNFIHLKKQNELTTPELVQQKITYLLAQPYTGEIIYSLREISI